MSDTPGGAGSEQDDPLAALTEALRDSKPAPPRASVPGAIWIPRRVNRAAVVSLVCGACAWLSVALVFLTETCVFAVGVFLFPVIGGISGVRGLQEARRTGIGRKATAAGMILCLIPMIVYILIACGPAILRVLYRL